MNWHRIRTVMVKEWEEALLNRTIIYTFLAMLCAFTVMPLLLAFVLPSIGGGTVVHDPDLDAMLGLLNRSMGGFSDLLPVQQFQVFMLRQFLILFLLLPIMGAMSIATYSIIGEKTTRSLEALLATPVRTDELLLGKSVAAALPTVLATWVAFAIMAACIRWFGGAAVLRYTLDGAAWGMILLLTPLVALLGLGLGVLVSARFNDPRSAQQVGVVLVLPIVGLLIAQVSGLLLIGLPTVLAGAALLVLVDAAVLKVGIALFDREEILTRWR